MWPEGVLALRFTDATSKSEGRRPSCELIWLEPAANTTKASAVRMEFRLHGRELVSPPKMAWPGLLPANRNRHPALARRSARPPNQRGGARGSPLTFHGGFV